MLRSHFSRPEVLDRHQARDREADEDDGEHHDAHDAEREARSVSVYNYAAFGRGGRGVDGTFVVRWSRHGDGKGY